MKPGSLNTSSGKGPLLITLESLLFVTPGSLNTGNSKGLLLIILESLLFVTYLIIIMPRSNSAISSYKSPFL